MQSTEGGSNQPQLFPSSCLSSHTYKTSRAVWPSVLLSDTRVPVPAQTFNILQQLFLRYPRPPHLPSQLVLGIQWCLPQSNLPAPQDLVISYFYSVTTQHALVRVGVSKLGCKGFFTFSNPVILDLGVGLQTNRISYSAKPGEGESLEEVQSRRGPQHGSLNVLGSPLLGGMGNLHFPPCFST